MRIYIQLHSEHIASNINYLQLTWLHIEESQFEFEVQQQMNIDEREFPYWYKYYRHKCHCRWYHSHRHCHRWFLLKLIKWTHFWGSYLHFNLLPPPGIIINIKWNRRCYCTVQHNTRKKGRRQRIGRWRKTQTEKQNNNNNQTYDRKALITDSLIGCNKQSILLYIEMQNKLHFLSQF